MLLRLVVTIVLQCLRRSPRVAGGGGCHGGGGGGGSTSRSTVAAAVAVAAKVAAVALALERWELQPEFHDPERASI